MAKDSGGPSPVRDSIVADIVLGIVVIGIIFFVFGVFL